MLHCFFLAAFLQWNVCEINKYLKSASLFFCRMKHRFLKLYLTFVLATHLFYKVDFRKETIYFFYRK